MTDDVLIDDIWAQLEQTKADGGLANTSGAGAPAQDERARFLSQSSEMVTKQRIEQDREQYRQAAAIGRVNDAICAQIHELWTNNIRPNLDSEDFITGSANPRHKCLDCTAQQFRLTMYLVQADANDPALIDTLKRQKSRDQMFLRDVALIDAEMCGLIGLAQRRTADDLAQRQALKAAKPHAQIDMSNYACLLHVCVEEFCLLPVASKGKHREMYNRIHAHQIGHTGVRPLVDTQIFFCARHTRFHVCDEFCDQTDAGRYNENVCVLSARVKRTSEAVFALPDGFGSAASGTGGGGGGAGATGDPFQDHETALEQDAEGIDTRPAARRRAPYSEVSVIRDRGEPMRSAAFGLAPARGARRRGRGRGRGSIAAGSVERSRMERIRLAETMMKSSGDADAANITPQQAAAQFERMAAGDMARRSTQVQLEQDADGNVTKRSTSQRRKLGRARRVKSRLSNQSSNMTLNLPRALLDGNTGQPLALLEAPSLLQIEDVQEKLLIDTSLLATMENDHDILMNNRLAVPLGFAEQAAAAYAAAAGAADEAQSPMVAVSFNVRAKIPFAERAPGKYDEEFALDVLFEQRDRDERLKRFHFEGTALSNTFFSTTQLFEQYCERACAIIWRLFCSRERDAIEESKSMVCANKTRSEIDTYIATQRKSGQAVYAERIERIARSAHDKAGIYKNIVIDEALWKIVETYNALLVVEFYFNLISLPRKHSIHLTQETADTITTHFYFENFVPAILWFLCEGLEVNGVVILPRDTFILREWWPQPVTLRTLGVADQTMTRLTSTVRSYIDAARSSNVSMRRFEATTIEMNELATLRLIDDPTLTSAELAHHAARSVVELFIERRARRLDALQHY